MEPIRRDALLKATIYEIGRAGSLDITVSQIAKTAGMSSALAHHYFGGKEQIFLAAMRHTLSEYGKEVRASLASVATPRERLEAVVKSGFTTTNFSTDVIAVWLNFYVLAQKSPEAHRLLIVYQRRLHSNLVHALRPLVGDRAAEIAETVGALIDGIYLRQVLGRNPPSGAAAAAQVLATLDLEIGSAQ